MQEYMTQEGEIEILPILREALYNKFSGARGGIHVSDLVTCTLKAYYGKTNPQKPTNKQINYFSSGNGIHDAVQSLVMTDPLRFRKEKSVRYKDVEGHVDIWDSINRVPIELKSMRIADSKEPLDYHMAQLKCYMAILDCDYGILLYQMLLHRNEEPFVEYKVRADRKERSKILKTLSERSDLLQQALKDNDPWDLPHIGMNPSYDWLCTTCSFYDECFPMRYRHLPYLLGITKTDERPLMDAPE